MRFILWPERVTGAAGRFGAWTGSAAAFLLVIVVAANIVARILGHSIPGILDISQNFMVIIVVMMLAYTQAQRGHIGVEFVTGFLPERGKRVVGLITLLLSLAFAVLLAWQSWAMAWSALQVRDHSGVYPNLPLYPWITRRRTCACRSPGFAGKRDEHRLCNGNHSVCRILAGF
ncbi:MAG: TRAP transporter small permease [Deltaproteobacteria bacterium]|nr:TRAP transporter small permease [Deltaproteobacteria bacterium]